MTVSRSGGPVFFHNQWSEAIIGIAADNMKLPLPNMFIAPPVVKQLSRGPPEEEPVHPPPPSGDFFTVVLSDDLLFIHGFHHRPARFRPVFDMFVPRACHQSHKECWSCHYHHHHHNHHESLWSQSDSDSTCSESETLSSTQAAKAWCNGLPQCRTKVQTNLIPNRQLDNLVEQLSRLEEEKAKESKRLCEEHQEPLKLFCQDDKTLICVICDKHKEHRDHQVVPLEEAAQQHKELITSHLELLKKDRAEIMTYKEERVNESKHLLTQTKAKMEKMKAEFRKLRQFLEEHEKLLMVQMEEVEKEIARKRDEHLARLSEELSSLGGLIQEMKQKFQQPLGELLQDVGRILQRSDEKVTFENPVVFLPELKWKIWDFCDINPFLGGVMNQFKDALVHGLQLQKAVQRSLNVTLDPDTAHLQLILSDHKSVTCGSKLQDLPDNPKRFGSAANVLGQERFTAGRNFWEVVVGSEEQWLAGVTQESVI
nr:LOW QUALITY PROTEIN: tripartite motif-containing protein 7-like [Pogona vitticeps]